MIILLKLNFITGINLPQGYLFGVIHILFFIQFTYRTAWQLAGSLKVHPNSQHKLIIQQLTLDKVVPGFVNPVFWDADGGLYALKNSKN